MGLLPRQFAFLLISTLATAAPPFNPIPAPALPICAPDPGIPNTGIHMTGTKVGILRGNSFNFDSNGNGSGPFGNDNADRVDNFAPPGGILPGDLPVVGDWNGDGHAKAGWFRPQGGQWWLDVNNDGLYTAGIDFNYTGFGAVGDIPVVGDWAGIGKTTIGVRNQGFLWLVDTVGNGRYSEPAPNCVGGGALNTSCASVYFAGSSKFAFGAPGDTPVVGNWSGKVSSAGFPIAQAGIVRPVGGSSCAAPPQPTTNCTPFLWVLDTGIAGTSTGITPLVGASNPQWNSAQTYSAGDLVTINNQIYYSLQNFNLTHQPGNGIPWWALVTNAAGQAIPTVNLHKEGNVFAFGGGASDIPVVGDWYNTGIAQAGVFRSFAPGTPNFLWVLDRDGPAFLQGTANHNPGLVFAYGGIAGDKPVTGRW